MEKPTIVTLKKGDVLREQGDYIVLSGYLICRLSRQLINFMSTGDFIATDNSIFRYEARSQVQLMLIQNDGIGSVQGRRELVLQERMLAVVRRMDGFLESLERRLIILLHQAGEEIGTVTKDNTCEIPSILTHQEIAQYLGCTREYLCGMRKKMMAVGKILDSKGWILAEWDGWQEEVNPVYNMGETRMANSSKY